MNVRRTWPSLDRLVTVRLVLAPIGPEDLDDVARVFADPEATWDYPNGPWTRDECVALVGRMRAMQSDRGYSYFGARLRENGRFVGFTGLLDQRIAGRDELEIGYRFAHEAWGRGYAVEAARALRDTAFGTLPVDRIVSIIRPDNARSRRVAERNGMVLEKMTRWEKLPGMDVCLYAIARDVWQRTRDLPEVP
ncbi:MAG: GNAT family N-acetyltransferase [Polyangiaceae bacterium]